ncbi:hypothetical protein [Sulfurisoma sediminicola]|uniref:hypothetical protein n=1 Tax=Sulfurisoma sediminicola TaxID=1381557 RepID=UPI001A9E703D|nr:hypothetical protein [Sulfurisoma sediminicola]
MGNLWDGRFKSCVAQAEAYLLACMRCIELNPVRAGNDRFIGTAGGAFVNRYQAGQLGITLPGAMTPPPELAPAAVEPVTRTSAWYNQDHVVIDARGLPAMEIRAQGDYGEVWGSGRLYGNASDNYLHNGEGDDELYGGDGDDALQGGEGKWRAISKSRQWWNGDATSVRINEVSWRAAA